MDRLTHMGSGALLVIVVPYVYSIVMEAMPTAAIGKMVLGVHVVKLDGSPMG